MKGLIDYLNNKESLHFKEARRILKNIDYDFDKIIEELKTNYGVTLQECSIQTHMNEFSDGIAMFFDSFEIYRFEIYTGNSILENFAKGLSKIPNILNKKTQ